MHRLYRVQTDPDIKTSHDPLPDWITAKESFQDAVKASGRWFGNSIEDCKWYVEHEYFDRNPVIMFIDVDDHTLKTYRVDALKANPNVPGMLPGDKPWKFSANPEAEWFLPQALAKTAQRLEGVAAMIEETAAPTRILMAERNRTVAARADKLIV